MSNYQNIKNTLIAKNTQLKTRFFSKISRFHKKFAIELEHELVIESKFYSRKLNFQIKQFVNEKITFDEKLNNFFFFESNQIDEFHATNKITINEKSSDFLFSSNQIDKSIATKINNILFDEKNNDFLFESNSIIALIITKVKTIIFNLKHFKIVFKLTQINILSATKINETLFDKKHFDFFIKIDST